MCTFAVCLKEQHGMCWNLNPGIVRGCMQCIRARVQHELDMRYGGHSLSCCQVDKLVKINCISNCVTLPRHKHQLLQSISS